MKTHYIKPILILVIVTSGLVLAYLWLNNWCADLESILKIVATCSGIMIAMYASFNLSRNVDAHQESIELKRKEYSLQLINKHYGSFISVIFVFKYFIVGKVLVFKKCYF